MHSSAVNFISGVEQLFLSIAGHRGAASLHLYGLQTLPRARDHNFLSPGKFWVIESVYAESHASKPLPWPHCLIRPVGHTRCPKGRSKLRGADVPAPTCCTPPARHHLRGENYVTRRYSMFNPLASAALATSSSPSESVGCMSQVKIIQGFKGPPKGYECHEDISTKHFATVAGLRASIRSSTPKHVGP